MKLCCTLCVKKDVYQNINASIALLGLLLKEDKEDIDVIRSYSASKYDGNDCQVRLK